MTLNSEVFKHDWMVVIIDVYNSKRHIVVNDREQLLKIYEENKNNIWIGYNSRHYDQWILKGIICDFNPKEINDFIIVEGKGGYEFSSLLNKIELNNLGFNFVNSFRGARGKSKQLVLSEIHLLI